MDSRIAQELIDGPLEHLIEVIAQSGGAGSKPDAAKAELMRRAILAQQAAARAQEEASYARKLVTG